MSALEWDHDEERRLERLSGHEAAFLQQAARQVARRIRKHDPRRVIDMEVRRPDEHRTAKFVGKCIGIGFWTALGVLAVGAIWSWRGAAWAFRFGVAALRPKEVV